ncbi:MAG: M43 family zinc metalloprotease [Kofleriaceae bacterium]
MLRNLLLVAMIGGVASAGPGLHPVHNADGSIQVGDHSYPSQKAFFESAEWQQSGGRCGTQTPPAMSLILPPTGSSDCTNIAEVINPAYIDGRVFVVQVVFHLIQKTDGTGNITDDQVRSQIQILNEDYQALSNTHGAPGNNAGIKFVLARFDPNGNPTTGIERFTNDSYFSEGDPGTSPMKTALHWDPTKYLNVYSNGLDSGQPALLGYATFPFDLAHTPSQDGVVLTYASVGLNAAYAPYDLGASATHEIGHWFGLFHTFQGGCGTANKPYSTGDLISDTVAEATDATNCTAHASGCSNGLNAPIENYMDYSYDTCMTTFTVEQINRARCGIVNYRTINTEPKSLFTFTTNMLAVTFTSASTDAESQAAQLHYNWDFGDGMMSTDQNPTHTYATAGSYNVKLEVVDPMSAANTSTQAIVVSDTGMGSDGSGSDGSGSDGSGTGGGGDAGTGAGGNETGGMNGGCCQAPKGGLSFLLCGVPVAFVLLRRRRRR